MPRAEKGTPKDIANKIKAKGLLKLKFYCEMCKKQCRDENGFKCHLMTDGHKRMMAIFAENTGRFLDEFSTEFNKTFMDLLKRQFGTRRVKATTVYNEFIHDRDHTHMNATIWPTLTDYVQYLGKSGKCVVDQADDGWYIRYIDRDPETLRRQAEAEKKEKMDMDDEERTARFIEKQIQRAQEAAKGESNGDVLPPAPSELNRAEIDPEKLAFSLNPLANSSNTTTSATPILQTALLRQTRALSNPLLDEDDDEEESPDKSKTTNSTSSSSSSLSSISSSTSLPKGFSFPTKSGTTSTESSNGGSVFKVNPVTPSSSSPSSSSKRKAVSAVEQIIAMEEKAKQSKVAKIDYWLTPGLVVRIITKSLKDGFYYKRKGVVLKVIDKYAADVKVQEIGDILRLDQDYLETVLPSLDSTVLVVNGPYRGSVATLLGLEKDKYEGKVRLESAPNVGKITYLPYEDICKFEDARL